MTSQILKSAGFTKIQKSRYLKNKTFFFSSNKKNHELHIKRCFMTKNSLVAEVTFKKRLQHRYFRMKFEKFLRTPILKKICERLLLINASFVIFFQEILRLEENLKTTLDELNLERKKYSRVEKELATSRNVKEKVKIVFYVCYLTVVICIWAQTFVSYNFPRRVYFVI